MSVTVIEVTEDGTLVFPDPQTVQEQVENGMRLLDEKFGTNFIDKIDPDRLDIGSGISCICGQLYGDYCNGRDKLGLTDHEAAKYGFYSRHVDRYGELTEAWRQGLLARSA